PDWYGPKRSKSRKRMAPITRKKVTRFSTEAGGPEPSVIWSHSPPAPSLERHLGEAAQLARMEPLHALIAQRLERPDADLQVLVDPFAVEARRHAGQLQLAMQRLVGDAEEGAVGHPEAKAVRRDGGALHVQRHRPAAIEALDQRGVRLQLPIAVVDRGDGARAHHALELIA